MKRGQPLRRTGFTPAQRSVRMTRTVMAKKRPKLSPEERAGRKGVKSRSEGVCEIDGSNPAAEVHHRQNRSQGGGWDLANLLHICTPCHRHVTVNPTAAMEQGWTVRSGRNPADVPCWLGGRGYVFLSGNGAVTEAPEEEEGVA